MLLVKIKLIKSVMKKNSSKIKNLSFTLNLIFFKKIVFFYYFIPRNYKQGHCFSYWKISDQRAAVLCVVEP